MSDTTEEKLARVQAAIAKIENGGQDITLDGKRVTRGDLSVLYAREDSLERKIARESRGGMRVRRGTPE